jgi:hypothetical protein
MVGRTEEDRMKTTWFETAYGRRALNRRAGQMGEFYEDTRGGWWVLNPQRGFVPIASNSRSLLAALAEER